MDYRILLSFVVQKKVYDISDYWIKNYNNNEFVELFYKEYTAIENSLKASPKIYPIYKDDIRKIVMQRLKYNLYYYIKNDLIVIIDIKSFKEKQ